MKLVHYSSGAVTAVLSADQLTLQQIKRSGHSWKPNGFWLSVDDADDGWRDWCISNDFHRDRLTHVHDVVLDGRILHIDSVAKLDQFDSEFGLNILGRMIGRDYGNDSLDWSRVAERYQGIIIAPYFWQRRLSSVRWYYSWDCASGCV